jgi:hypothetical protein
MVSPVFYDAPARIIGRAHLLLFMPFDFIAGAPDTAYTASADTNQQSTAHARLRPPGPSSLPHRG